MTELISPSEKSHKDMPRWQIKARKKAILNEKLFNDADGNYQKNNWHHVEWFELAEQYDRLLIEAAREHSKTQIFVFTQPLLEIKANRNIRILIISAAYQQSKERTRVLRNHIERNVAYHELNPPIIMDKKSGDEEFTVERPMYWLKEPTVRSTYALAPIAGGRYDIIIVDDLVIFAQNSNSPEARQKIKRWWSDEVLNSVTKNGKIWVIGTRQHHDDLYENVKKDARFRTFTYPAIDERWIEKNKARGIEGDDVHCLWPEMHNYEVLMAKKEADEDSFFRQQQQIAIPETGLVYRRVLVDSAFERGSNMGGFRQGAPQFVGLDPGYGQRAAMLAIQELSGDRVDVWKEHSFTQLADDDIAEVVSDHCREYRVEAVFYDAEDPGLGAAVLKALKRKGLPTKIQQVPFKQFKQLSIKVVRWLLQTERITFSLSETTNHRPGRPYQRFECLFRNEIRDYALKEGEDFEPMKGEDHGPDALSCYASKWVKAWAKASGQDSLGNVRSIMSAKEKNARTAAAHAPNTLRDPTLLGRRVR